MHKKEQKILILKKAYAAPKQSCLETVLYDFADKPDIFKLIITLTPLYPTFPHKILRRKLMFTQYPSISFSISIFVNPLTILIDILGTTSTTKTLIFH